MATKKKKATKRLAKQAELNQTPSQRGKRSIRAGKTWERQVALMFQAAGFPEAKRGIKQTRGGSEEPDVTGVPGWWIECKSGTCPSIARAWDQAAEARSEWRLSMPPSERPRCILLAIRRTVRVASGGQIAFLPMAVISELTAVRLQVPRTCHECARFPWQEYAKLRQSDSAIAWSGWVAFPLAWAIEDGWFKS